MFNNLPVLILNMKIYFNSSYYHRTLVDSDGSLNKVDYYFSAIDAVGAYLVSTDDSLKFHVDITEINYPSELTSATLTFMIDTA